jgi:excisionase family DNA binding protein
MTYTVSEAAKVLGISRTMAYELAGSGELPGARKLGHRIIVSRPVLEAWLLESGEAA